MDIQGVSDHENPSNRPETGTSAERDQPGEAATRADHIPSPAPAPGDTVGTGSVIALGCIGGTVFLIVLGLIYLLASQIFG